MLEALLRIPVQQQILLEQYDWEEVPGPERARALDVAPGTVRTRLHRARVALREQLEALAVDLRLLDDIEGSVQAAAPS